MCSPLRAALLGTSWSREGRRCARDLANPVRSTPSICAATPRLSRPVSPGLRPAEVKVNRRGHPGFGAHQDEQRGTAHGAFRVRSAQTDPSARTGLLSVPACSRRTMNRNALPSRRTGCRWRTRRDATPCTMHFLSYRHLELDRIFSTQPDASDNTTLEACSRAVLAIRTAFRDLNGRQGVLVTENSLSDQ